ncbi:7524_t:CDS:1, partial [Diversispora eburnea]
RVPVSNFSFCVEQWRDWHVQCIMAHTVVVMTFVVCVTAMSSINTGEH